MSSKTIAHPEAPPSARDRILQTAGRLFYHEGYRAVGIDRVIAEANVAKATFYKHFPSKDALISAWITGGDWESPEDLPPEDGPEPLTAYALGHLAAARSAASRGCALQGAAAEFADPDHPAHAAAMASKTRALAALERRAEAQGFPDARATAIAVFLLLEGVLASVRMFGADAPLDNAEAALRKLVS